MKVSSQLADPARIGPGGLSRTMGLTALLVVAAFAAAPAWAQYSIRWFTVAGGGGSGILGGPYQLSATIGQPDAGFLAGGGYSLAGGLWAGRGAVVGVDPGARRGGGTALAFQLHEADPNPMTRRTLLAFDLPQPLSARVVLYDAAGRRVRILAEGRFPAGQHQRFWDGTDEAGSRVATGIYFARLEAGSMKVQKRIVLIR